MSDVILTCPFCRFTKRVPRSILPQNAQWATCPKCRKRFPLVPAAVEEGPSLPGIGVRATH